MIFYRKILTLIFFVTLYSQTISINDCSFSELEDLPISQNKIESIYEYLSKSGSIEEIFDLLNAENITVEDIHKIKPFIVIHAQEDSQYIKNKKKSSYKLERWLGAEGNSEGLSEIWLDYFFEPQNINTMTRDQLFNLPNLSPIDVVAILKQKESIAYLLVTIKMTRSFIFFYVLRNNARTSRLIDDFKMCQVNIDDDNCNIVWRVTSIQSSLLRRLREFLRRLGGRYTRCGLLKRGVLPKSNA